LDVLTSLSKARSRSKDLGEALRGGTVGVQTKRTTFVKKATRDAQCRNAPPAGAGIKLPGLVRTKCLNCGGTVKHGKDGIKEIAICAGGGALDEKSCGWRGSWLKR
jgi:hypothetical protein